MKMLVAIVQDYDASRLLRDLIDAGYGATYIGSTGGFLRSGTAAVLIGVSEERASAALAIVHRLASARVAAQTTTPNDLEVEFLYDPDDSVEMGGADVFVLRVARFERM
ncbi:MAG TPA: cyclic-di-AMP receptor [Thermomicrobiales bacterium]|jgi:uncharacterized protein YaaQ|nr:hypothetical protein [Chloroflexota bacterium]HBY46621.1 hypothetical protein [Chloroflexota bacterium]HCG31120.1 hypothetical protein [Chloroflexota bacterium]HQZ89945.1 cyclic-di-AMP receptor [Thermomicrobiales bacterium]HRA31781.1 cyclic-di-AMP receptor [Thermomicrobiales bacterium]